MKNLIATEMATAVERVDLGFKSNPGIIEGERVESSIDQTSTSSATTPSCR